MIATIAAGWVDSLNPVVFEICGTDGHAVVFNNQLYFQSGKVEGADGQTPWTDLPAAMPHAFELFLDALLDGKDVPLVNVNDAADRNVVMSGFYRSLTSGKWETV